MQYRPYRPLQVARARDCRSLWLRWATQAWPRTQFLVAALWAAGSQGDTSQGVLGGASSVPGAQAAPVDLAVEVGVAECWTLRSGPGEDGDPRSYFWLAARLCLSS